MWNKEGRDQSPKEFYLGKIRLIFANDSVEEHVEDKGLDVSEHGVNCAELHLMGQSAAKLPGVKKDATNQGPPKVQHAHTIFQKANRLRDVHFVHAEPSSKPKP